LETQLRADAERSLRRSFVLQAIAAEEGIEVEEADVDTGIREALTADGGNARDIGRALRQPEIRDRVRSALLEQQTAKWLIERALGPAPEASADEDEAEAEGENES
jgi:FKBP-type peptidyl-prolyl cis-trans isomerase (trigger factor)